MNTRHVPAIITLLAGLITCIISFLTHASMEDFLIHLILVIVIFFIMGCVIKAILDKSFKEKEETEDTGEDTESKDEEGQGKMTGPKEQTEQKKETE